MNATRLGNRQTAKHLYRLEVYLSPTSQNFEIEVDANSRSQAAHIAQKAGYVVCSVNMIG